MLVKYHLFLIPKRYFYGWDDFHYWGWYWESFIDGQQYWKFWWPIISYEVSEFLDEYTLHKGQPKSTLEYGCVDYWIQSQTSLEAITKYSIHCFSLHRRMWNRQRKTEISKIYLPVKWVNDISFLFFFKYFEILMKNNVREHNSSVTSYWNLNQNDQCYELLKP